MTDTSAVIANNIVKNDSVDTDSKEHTILMLQKISLYQKKLLIPLVMMMLLDMLPRLYAHFEWQFAKGIADNIFLLIGTLSVYVACIVFYVWNTVKFSRMFNHKMKTTFLAILAIINAVNIIPYVILSIQSHKVLKRYGLSGYRFVSESTIRQKVTVSSIK
ncbi:hypothetical protein [uncultured Shewanella sp.]|uniref:hypothetical protein n=1 Tax=uncultured Shewanella sp. TaxID=173975 RepID=UPI002628DF34|nr:hypothetical protein [uncultured Shewanella sp.]